jgi:hypothetical protein
VIEGRVSSEGEKLSCQAEHVSVLKSVWHIAKVRSRRKKVGARETRYDRDDCFWTAVSFVC